MQENSNPTLANLIDSVYTLNNALKYTFVADRALSYAVREGLFDLQDDEISGMNNTKSILLDRYEELKNNLENLHESTK